MRHRWDSGGCRVHGIYGTRSGDAYARRVPGSRTVRICFGAQVEPRDDSLQCPGDRESGQRWRTWSLTPADLPHERCCRVIDGRIGVGKLIVLAR